MTNKNKIQTLFQFPAVIFVVAVIVLSFLFASSFYLHPSPSAYIFADDEPLAYDECYVCQYQNTYFSECALFDNKIGCETYTAPIINTPECVWYEKTNEKNQEKVGVCLPRFLTSCLDWLKNQQQNKGDKRIVAEPISTNTTMAKFLTGQNISCKKRPVYRYEGHGRGCLLAADAAIGCLALSSESEKIVAIEESCSTFEEPAEAFNAALLIQKEMKKRGKREVRWEGDQHILVSGEYGKGGYIAPMAIIITPTQINAEYGSCNTLGGKGSVENQCFGTIGGAFKTAVCTDRNGKNITKICCPNRLSSTDYAWTDLINGNCSGYKTLDKGECKYTVPIHQIGSNQYTWSVNKALAEIKKCVAREQNRCENKIGGILSLSTPTELINVEKKTRTIVRDWVCLIKL